MTGIIIYFAILAPYLIFSLFWDARKNSEISRLKDENDRYQNLLSKYKYTEADMNDIYEWAQRPENQGLKSPVTYWNLERFAESGPFEFDHLQNASEQLENFKPKYHEH